MSAWFPGPKAENAEWERKMISHILQDYFHWRRNYYPSDEILVPRKPAPRAGSIFTTT